MAREHVVNEVLTQIDLSSGEYVSADVVEEVIKLWQDAYQSQSFRTGHMCAH